MRFRTLAATTALLTACANPETISLEKGALYDTIASEILAKEANDASDRIAQYFADEVSSAPTNSLKVRVLLGECIALDESQLSSTAHDTTPESIGAVAIINPIMMTSGDGLANGDPEIASELFVNFPVGIRTNAGSTQAYAVRGPVIAGKVTDERVAIDSSSPGFAIQSYALHGDEHIYPPIERGPGGTFQPEERMVDLLTIDGAPELRLSSNQSIRVGTVIPFSHEEAGGNSSMELCWLAEQKL